MKVDKEFIREAVAGVICCDADTIQDTTNFISDLEVNSIQMLEIVAAIEDEYDIEVKANEFTKYDTINKIVETLEKM